MHKLIGQGLGLNPDMGGTVVEPAKHRLPANRHSLYAISGWLDEEVAELAIGKLGIFSFRRGLYVYVGSARRNPRARIGRHLRTEKTMRWHFDYLRPHLRIVGVDTFPGDEGECRLFRRLMEACGGTVPVRGFGSSDCGCEAHLFYVPRAADPIPAGVLAGGTGFPVYPIPQE